MKVFRFMVFLLLYSLATWAVGIDVSDFSPEKQAQEIQQLETLMRSANLTGLSKKDYSTLSSLFHYSSFSEVRQKTIEFLLSEVKDMSTLLTSSELSSDQKKEVIEKHWLKEFPFDIQRTMFNSLYVTDHRKHEQEHQQIREFLVILGSIGLVNKSLQSDMRALTLDFEARNSSHGPSLSKITKWVYAIENPVLWTATGKEKDMLIRELSYMDSILLDPSYSKEQKQALIQFWQHTKFDSSIQHILFEIVAPPVSILSRKFNLAQVSTAEHILQRLNRMGVLYSHYSSKMDKMKHDNPLKQWVKQWVRRCALAFS